MLVSRPLQEYAMRSFRTCHNDNTPLSFFPQPQPIGRPIRWENISSAFVSRHQRQTYNTILWCRVRLILPSKSTICTSMASELSQPQPRTTLHSPLQQLHVSSLTSFPRLLLHFGIACLRVKPPCAGTRDVCTPLKAPSLLVLWRRNDKCQLHTRFCNLLPTCYIST
jgi:hypothetical protein